MSDLSSMDQMLEMFLFEMNSLIEQLDEILLSSEKSGALTENDVNEIFRIMHTVKGSSAMMEFELITSVTHKLEDTFYVIRDQGIDQSHFTELFDLMLDATDFLKRQLESIQNGAGELSDGADELIARTVAFKATLTGDGVPAAAQPEPEPEPEQSAPEPLPEISEPPAGQPVQTAAPDVPASHSGTVFSAEIQFEDDCGMENLRAFMLLSILKEHCAIHAFEPADIEFNPETAMDIMMNGFKITLECDMADEELQTLIEQQLHVKSAMVSVLSTAVKAQSNLSGDRYHVHILFEEDCSMENLRAFMLINSLRQSCGIIGFSPDDIETNSETAAIIARDGFIIELETPLSTGELQKLLDTSMHVRSASLTKRSPEPDSRAAPEAAPTGQPAANASAPAAKAQAPAATKSQQAPTAAKAPPPVPPPAAKAPQAAGKPIKQNLINVSLSKLDELMDLMGELVITNSMVIHSPDLKGLTKLDNFNKSARQLQKLTDELQDMVMSVRMVPVAGTFQKMQRIVRDMCRNLGKEVDLLTMGEETDIDKTIIDGIADPIMHLVRNSMDHGVETPEERLAAGKSSKGTITLSAQNTGGEILITVSDDGKGLDAEALLKKAQKNGILVKPASEYTEKEAFMLLCAPGFSTKEQVTEYSGRGVGMDVVKKNIENIGGTVIIESKKGYGMSVFLKIPLTLAIADGMDVTVGDGIYTLQITSINESFKATKDQLIVDTQGNEMIMIRGDVYPIVRLHELYNVPDAITDIEEGILMWVRSGDQSACLFVDQLIGEQQIVVKPLPVYLKRYDIKSFGISGCTILGDGNISLILDVGSIIEKVLEKR